MRQAERGLCERFHAFTAAFDLLADNMRIIPSAPNSCTGAALRAALHANDEDAAGGDEDETGDGLADLVDDS